MSDEDYINETIKRILDLQQKSNGKLNHNMNQNFGLNPDANIEQSLTNAILEPLLNPSEIKTSGKYLIDSNGNKVALYEKIEGSRRNPEEINEEIALEYFYTMDDGTSLGEYAECMNHGGTVLKENIFRCPVCGITVCVLCGIPSQSGKYYCSRWHRIIGEGLF